MNKKFCVVSHTHWDREWYLPFELFRMRLVKLIDNLFNILEEYPEYIFHLDAQTIILEDYLEICPENREKLEKYIKSGNIIVGPWYVQNDFYLTCGEATVRNIIIGTEIAESFGKCGKIGYTPDQFGLPGQLPQIFKQFGIKYHIFGRGWRFYDDDGNQIHTPCDAYWKAPDGSKVFSVLMPFWYNNAQRINSDANKAKAEFDKAETNFEKCSSSDYLLMMNGVDHLEPQDDLIPAIKAVNSVYGEERVVQMSMDEYMDKEIAYVGDNERCGELRYGNNNDILAGTFSTRIDIKKQNYDAQNMILLQIEPLYSMLGVLGFDDKYPKHMLRHMWKELMKNHPHDSICCCSCNNVMRHMKDRFLSLNEIGTKLIEDGCKYFSHHITRENNGEAKYYFTVINTSQVDYSGVMTVEFDFPAWDDDGDFVILSADNRKVPFEVVEEKNENKGSYSELNLPGNFEVITRRVNVFVENIPAFGYENFIVANGTGKPLEREYDFFENDYIKLEFEKGHFRFIDKERENVYNDIVFFDDLGDTGNSYISNNVKDSSYHDAEFINMQVLEDTPLVSKMLVTYRIVSPEFIADDGEIGKDVTNYIYLTVTLKKASKHIDFDVKIENNGKNHLIRVGVDTGIINNLSYASSIYDIVERDRSKINTQIINATEPVNGFVYKRGNGNGIAVYTKGLYEYEDAGDGRIYISLLRSSGLISSPKSEKRFWAPDDNFMLGTTEVSFSISAIDENTKVHAYENSISAQPLYWFDSVNIRMFEGGRADVQDSDVKELYFHKDEYEDIILPHRGQLFEVNDSMCVTAFKQAEDKSGYLLRMYNPYDCPIDDIAVLDNDAMKINMAEDTEEPFDNHADKKEIISIKIKNRRNVK